MQQHLTFVEQNYRCKAGEIDLIFRSGQLWIFVEVKYREQSDHGCALEFVTATKKHRMINAIKWYFMQKQMNLHHEAIRLDVIAIDGQTLHWIKGIT